MDRKFTIYNLNGVYLGGKIENGRLTIDSEIYTDDYDSEAHYFLSKTETNKLFNVVSLDEFIARFKNGNLTKMLKFFDEKEIKYERVYY